MNKLALTALFATAAFAGEWTGYISESGCGAKHVDGSEASVKCVTSCIGRGQKPVLVVGDKVIKIANPDKVAAATYGKKVVAKGDLKDDTVTLTSVEAAK